MLFLKSYPLLSAGLEEQLIQLTDEKNLQAHQWNQQRDEMKQKIKSLKTETKILKIENGDQGQQIRRQETMIRDQGQQIRRQETQNEKQGQQITRLKTQKEEQGQQITRLETENEVKEQQLTEMSHQITQLVNSSKEKTELLQGQGQDIAGLLVTNDFNISRNCSS